MLYLIEFLHQTTTKNLSLSLQPPLYLIEFLHQTTTRGKPLSEYCKLYLIEFLHQTTTCRRCATWRAGLYLIEFLHQTTTGSRAGRGRPWLYLIEFLHQTTTFFLPFHVRFKLYLIEFLHQTTTILSKIWLYLCCILLNFYIKPQLVVLVLALDRVVSYWISTSNHNDYIGVARVAELYLIEFLHQTTTVVDDDQHTMGCILLNFYIKPQRCRTYRPNPAVVSYWISTSNHNYK